MSRRKILTVSMPQPVYEKAALIAKAEKLTLSELFRRALSDFEDNRRWDRVRLAGRRSAERPQWTENDVDALIHEYHRGK